MSGARDHVLGRIGAALGDAPPSRAEARAEARARLKTPRAGPVPSRALVNDKARVELFLEEARRVEATAVRVASPSEVAAAVARYLAENGLPGELRVAPHPELKNIPWAEQSHLAHLTVRHGPAEGSDPVGVAVAFAGIAETGTLVLLSGRETPTTLNFLPDTHIVVLPTARVHGTYEDVWAALRARGRGFMPRTVNWITGPSRTADIEQTILLGAHGPRRLHIILIDGDA